MDYEYILAFYEPDHNRWTPYGDIFHSRESAQDDCDYWRVKYTGTQYRVLRRTVSDWEWNY